MNYIYDNFNNFIEINEIVKKNEGAGWKNKAMYL